MNDNYNELTLEKLLKQKKIYEKEIDNIVFLANPSQTEFEKELEKWSKKMSILMKLTYLILKKRGEANI